MYIFVLKNTKDSNKYKIFRKKKKFFSINFIAPFTTDTYYFETNNKLDVLKFLYLNCDITKNKLIKQYIESNNYLTNIEFLKDYHSKTRYEMFFANNIYNKIDLNMESMTKLPGGNQIFINCF